MTVRSHFERLESVAPISDSARVENPTPEKSTRSAHVTQRATQVSTGNADVGQATGHSETPIRGSTSLYEQLLGEQKRGDRIERSALGACNAAYNGGFNEQRGRW